MELRVEDLGFGGFWISGLRVWGLRVQDFGPLDLRLGVLGFRVCTISVIDLCNFRDLSRRASSSCLLLHQRKPELHRHPAATVYALGYKV